MLKVKTYLDKSPINGIGLFASQFIPKGEIVWKLERDFDRTYHESELTNSETLEIKFLKKYSYKDDKYYYLCIDDARFMNHSKCPNTCNGKDTETIASKDINIGEEITCDYFEIDDSAYEKFSI